MSKDDKYVLWGPILLVLVLALAGYLLKMRNYETITADPCLLKSPNECKDMNGQNSQAPQ